MSALFSQRLWLPASTAAIILFWFFAARAPQAAAAPWWDNLHWTFSYAVAALVTYWGWRQASPEQAPARRWFCWSMVSITVGQVLWDIQVWRDWNPFPAPSDFFYLLQAPLFLVGLLSHAGTALTRAKIRLLLLDVAGFSLALLALVLTLYLPKGLHSPPLQMLVFTAYPLLMLSTSAAALVLQLTLRLQLNLRLLATQAGLIALGIFWLCWNAETLDNTLSNGAPLNLGFSLVAMVLGWGSAGWRWDRNPSPRFDRHCETVLRLLPLAMVALASTAMGLLVLGGGVSTTGRNLLLGLGLLTLLFAMLRQTQQLTERDRLLEAERVVAESQAQLRHLAHHDPLTGLPNLALLRDRVEQALRVAERQQHSVALMFIDLDQFKEVNDNLGHAAGDALLQHVAQQLQQSLRQSDTVSRQGGDEFCLVLPEVEDGHQVLEVAEKVMAISRSTLMHAGQELSLAMSVGIALYPKDGGDFNTLLQRADAAMYRAKASGRNAYRLYDPKMQQESSERMQLRIKLSRALERGELSLHYQPQLDLHTGHICGAEALLRWHHPELGPVSPAQFIPVAEDSGLIVDIGAWVLRQACQQAQEWQAQGLPALTMAVNLSVLQFRRGNLEHTVQQALAHSGLPPPQLELEITESVLMQDHDKVFATVDNLQKLGVQLAIDDFGTGYSSLSYVKRLHVRKLKIDKSFVADALHNTSGAGIVRAVIEMARVLDMRTVAEGVETADQRDFLQQNHCDEIQGYLFARPMPAADFAQFVRQHHLSTAPTP